MEKININGIEFTRYLDTGVFPKYVYSKDKRKKPSTRVDFLPFLLLVLLIFVPLS